MVGALRNQFSGFRLEVSAFFRSSAFGLRICRGFDIQTPSSRVVGLGSGRVRFIEERTALTREAMPLENQGAFRLRIQFDR